MLYVLGITFCLLIIFLVKARGKTSEKSDKYREGYSLEEYVEMKLRKLEQAGGKSIKNCYLKWQNGNTTEIDNILIFRSGIYVIECKDYSGWIFGSSSNEYWTQTLSYGYQGAHIKRQFYNPIHQNQSHIACIRQKLRGYNSIPMYNIVVFGDECTFKSFENSSNAYVIRASSLYETIWKIEQNTNSKLSQPDIDSIYDILVNDVPKNYQTELQHIYNVERIKQQKLLERISTGDTCPRCGAQLVLRHGRYGSFYGCSRYPDCKYIRKKKKRLVLYMRVSVIS